MPKDICSDRIAELLNIVIKFSVEGLAIIRDHYDNVYDDSDSTKTAGPTFL